MVSPEGTEITGRQGRGDDRFRNLFFHNLYPSYGWHSLFLVVSNKKKSLKVALKTHKRCFDKRHRAPNNGTHDHFKEHSFPANRRSQCSFDKQRFSISGEYKCFFNWLMKAGGINLTIQNDKHVVSMAG